MAFTSAGSMIIGKKMLEIQRGSLANPAKSIRGRPLPGLTLPGRSNGMPLDATDDELLGQKSSHGVTSGAAERIQTSADDVPFRQICLLDFRTADGSRKSGTGWLVGPSTVITAGHCVWDHENGNDFNQSMQVYAARNGDRFSFSANAVDFQTVNAWAQQRDPNFNYGAIFLDRPLGDLLGFLGFAEFPDKDLNGMIVNVVGYLDTLKNEISVPSPVLIGQANCIEEARPHELVYMSDAAQVQSGSPVIYWDGSESFAVVGIQNEGLTSGNYAIRITADIFNNISRWKSYQGTPSSTTGRETTGVPVEVDQFDRPAVWTAELNRRRFELIDRDIQGTLTPAEHFELAGLTKLMREQVESEENLPMDGARALHKFLLDSAFSSTDP